MDRGEAGGRGVCRGSVTSWKQQECGRYASCDEDCNAEPRMTILEDCRNHGCHVSISAPFKPRSPPSRVRKASGSDRDGHRVLAAGSQPLSTDAHGEELLEMPYWRRCQRDAALVSIRFSRRQPGYNVSTACGQLCEFLSVRCSAASRYAARANGHYPPRP